MTVRDIRVILREVGIVGTCLIFLLYSYVKVVNQVIPILQHHNDELAELITLTNQILEQLRARPL